MFSITFRKCFQDNVSASVTSQDGTAHWRQLRWSHNCQKRKVSWASLAQNSLTVLWLFIKDTQLFPFTYIQRVIYQPSMVLPGKICPVPNLFEQEYFLNQPNHLSMQSNISLQIFLHYHFKQSKINVRLITIFTC